jgi:PhnB protein
MRLYTHLNFGGNCAEAFRAYERHLGGKLTTVMTRRELPSGMPRPQMSDDAVIHARLGIEDGELIGNDVPASHFKPIRSSYLYLAVDSPSAADRIYASLSKDGEVGMPMAETFFATRFAQLRDRFGVLWTIIHERPQ